MRLNFRTCSLCFFAYQAFCLTVPANAQATVPGAIIETCGMTDLVIQFSESQFNQAVVSITAKANNGDGTMSVLTFKARSFGYECRKNILGWGVFVVFQTACPVKRGIHDQYEHCDFKNNFGVIFGSDVLAVPSAQDGMVAAHVFHYPYDKKIPELTPVKLIFQAKEF